MAVTLPGRSRRLAALMVLLPLLASCGTTRLPALMPATLPTAMRPIAPQPALSERATTMGDWEPDGTKPYTPTWSINEVRLHVEGAETFPAMEALLGRAKHLIQIDYFIFSGKEAVRLATILKAQVKAGVRVELMVDPELGGLGYIQKGSTPVLADLLANGATVKDYPLDKLKAISDGGHVVDHDKVVVVDGREAMVGGMNIADVFLNNHDFSIELAGPAARDLAQNERYDFRQATPFHAESIGDPAQVRVCATGIDRSFDKEAVLAAINAAQRTCYVEMFQLTNEDCVAALIAAAQRGVDVRVIVDPGTQDNLIPFVAKAPKGFPNLPAALDLKKAKVPVHWYRLKPGMTEMHAKVAVIDGDHCFVGSTNWSHRGFAGNNETSVEVVGGSAPGRLHEVFLQDWATQSDEVTEGQTLLSALKVWVIHNTYWP